MPQTLFLINTSTGTLKYFSPATKLPNHKDTGIKEIATYKTNRSMKCLLEKQGDQTSAKKRKSGTVHPQRKATPKCQNCKAISHTKHNSIMVFHRNHTTMFTAISSTPFNVFICSVTMHGRSIIVGGKNFQVQKFFLFSWNTPSIKVYVVSSK